MWKFKFVSDREEAFSERLWANLRRDHVFNHPRLIRAWIDSFGTAHKISLLFAEGHNPDGNRSLWPLVIWHRNWKNAFQRVVIPAGGSDFDYHSPMLEKDSAADTDLSYYLQDLSRALLAHGGFDEINLTGIPDSLLQKSEPANLKKDEICPMLHLDNFHSEEDLMKFFKTSLRGDLRRQMRRLSEHGKVQLVEFNSREQAQPEFEPFMEAHTSRWPNAYKIPGFHRNLLKLLPSPVHFSALKVGDKTVAWHLGFQDENRYYYYMPAGNPEYSQYSPVKLHLLQLVIRAIEKGIHVFDHLRGDELYKGGWSNDLQYVNVHDITPPRKIFAAA